MEKLTNRLFKLPDLEQVDEPIIFESYDSIKGIILDSIRSIEIEYKNKLEDNYIRTEIGELEFCKGRLYVLTARHSYHTFCLSLNLIKDLAVDKKKPVGWINAGPDKDHYFGNQLLSITSRIPCYKVGTGNFTTEELSSIQDAADKIFYESHIYTVNKPNGSFKEFELSLKKMINEKHIEFLVVEGFDFFAELVDCKSKNYRKQLQRLLLSFKNFAKEYNIPVLLIIESDDLTKDYDTMTFKEIFKRRIAIPQIADMVLHLSATYDRENRNWNYVLENNIYSGNHRFEISPLGTGIFSEIIFRDQ